MKSPMRLFQVVLEELGTRCCTSTSMDLKKAHARFEHEGLSFLTIALPAFCQDFQKGLDEGQVGLNLFAGFRRRGGLPLFLGGFLDRVFDRRSGRLLDEPDTDCIFAVRQITLLFSKILVPCSDARVRGAVDKYIECEKDVREADRRMTPELLSQFERLSVLLFGEVFNAVDREVYDQTLIPKHGPGSTADRLKGNLKFDQLEWTARAERVFPFGEYAIPNWRFNYLLDRVSILEPGAERPVRVITVPKTLKTPRIIAIEPTCMQYLQQAVSEALTTALEASFIGPQIGFTDQFPNQECARVGPAMGLATLDMSEASDRVSNQHVRALLCLWPHLREAVDASRSRKADVPGHGVIRLAKFASMGSALCFPMEAMVFLTLVYCGIERELNRRLTRSDVMSLHGKVRVYGDDIIVPVDYVRSSIASLEAFGLRVNSDKSFWNGKFRESCGKEYYDGVDVSVTKCRRPLPAGRMNAQEVISAVSLRNQFYFAGLWQSARWMDSWLEPLLGAFPTVLPTSPALGRHSFLGFHAEKQHAGLHKPLVKAHVVNSRLPRIRASGEGSLMKWFLKRSEQPFADRDHLDRSGRPSVVNIKLRWASAV